jgi:beta-galactosidase
MLWSHKDPTRLSLRLKNRIAGRDVEFYDFALGMRQVEFKRGSYTINGVSEHIEWHDLSPRSTIADMEEILDRGIYAVRFTAGYVSDELLDFCDANGIYVAITAPINSSAMGSSRKRNGNPSNNPAWCEEYTERTLQMIHTTKRYSCVIAYYLAEDSANGICLYDSYLEAKKITSTPIFYDDGGNEWNSDNREHR